MAERLVLLLYFSIVSIIPRVDGASKLYLGLCEMNEDNNNPPPFPAVVVMTKNSIESSDPIVPLPGDAEISVEIFVDYSDTYADATNIGMTHLMGDRLEGETRPPVHGVIGCGGSSLSMHVAPFGAFLGIPLVSWWAGAPGLSNKLEYPYFLRTRGTSTGNGAGVVVLCHHFGWMQIGFIYQGQSFHVGVYDGAAAKAVELGVNVDPYVLFHFPDVVDNEVWKIKMEEAASSGNRVFGMSVVGVRGVNALTIGLSLGMNNRLFVQALELADFYPNHPQHIKDAWNGLIGIDYGQSGHNAQADRFEAMWHNMTFTKMRESGIIPERWTALIEQQTPDIFTRSPFMQFQAYLFDAVMALAIAFQSMLDSGIPGNKTSYGQDYVDTLFATSFTGPSGFVSFTPVVNGKGGDRDASTFNVFNAWNSEVRLIGTLAVSVSLDQSPIFPDGTSDPRNYDKAIVCAQGEALKQASDGSGFVCEQCPGGTGVSDDGRDCVACEPGYAAPVGSGRCSPCVIGTYQPGRAGDDASRCSDCEPGSFTNTTGQSSCVPCAPGTVSPTSGQTACEVCAKGTAQEQPGQQTCTRCKEGTYAEEEGWIQCEPCKDPLARTLGLGAISVSECVCREGTFTRGGVSPCEPCLEGMFCGLGSNLDNYYHVSNASSSTLPEELRVFPVLQRGFFSTQGLPLEVFECQSDTRCPGGVPGTCSDTASNKDFECPSCPDSTYVDEDTGKCEDCRFLDFFIVLLVAGIGIAVAASVFLISAVDVTTQKPQALLLAMTAGQICTFVQVLAAFSATDFDWGDPLTGVLEAFSLVSLNFELIRIQCVSLMDSAGNYAIQVLAPSIGVLVIVITYFLARQCGWKVTLNGLINSIGQLAVLLYISLTMVALTPFHCYSHPNGKRSLLGYPEVLCWDSDAHSTMFTFGILAILLYPVATMVIVFYAVHQYPMVMLRDSISFVSRYRFLFFRWVPSCYWFISVLILRNFCISVFPMVIPVEDNEVTGVLMHAVLLISFGLTVKFQPWRTASMNFLDGFLSIWQLILLNVGMLSVEDADVDSGVSIILTVAMAGCFFVAAALGFWYLYQWLRGGKLYSVFLSHHKGSGACTARLLKMMLVKTLKQPVFYDCDNLTSLGGIFDAVRASRSMLVVLTGETLCRPWCVGEVVTAHMCAVPMHPLTFTEGAQGENIGGADKFLTMSSEQREEVFHSFEVLRPFGIPLDRVSEAVDALLRSDMLKLLVQQRGGLESAVQEISKVVGGHQRQSQSLVGGSSFGIWRASSATVDDVFTSGGCRILISTDPQDHEACACSHILRLSLQARLQESVYMDFVMDATECVSTMVSTQLNVIVWVATPNTMKSPKQLGRAGLLLRVRPRAQLLLLIVGEGFTFPTTAFYDGLASGQEGLLEGDITKATGYAVTPVDVCAALRVIFAGIAIFINIPAIDEAMLSLSMDKVITRLKTMPPLQVEEQLSGGLAVDELVLATSPRAVNHNGNGSVGKSEVQEAKLSPRPSPPTMDQATVPLSAGLNFEVEA